ncbi:MAG: HypC/HybG/HupF family hydrogenase formation chaperone [Candidatus Hermodarchaeota archaeon]
MCLAVPTRVVEILSEKVAKVDIGGGVLKEIDITLVQPIEAGDYVLLHSGFAIEKLNPKDAEETLKLWEEVLSLD